MSSTDLNNEDYFSDHPKRLPSFDDLFRGQSQLSPERFFRNLEQPPGASHCSEDDFHRAVFLFRRLQCTRRTISRLIIFLTAVSVVPFVCLALPEDWRLAVFATGIGSELIAGAFLFVEHGRWQGRRRDYCHWLRLVHRRVNEL